jgi:hypothetical protein
MRRIRNAGHAPVFRLLRSGLTIDEANALEKSLISKLGRRDLRTGPLANLTAGGDGGNGRVMSAETIAHLREMNRRKFLPPHLVNINVWYPSFRYVSDYGGKHAPARYRCILHGLVFSNPREVERAIERGRVPCPECGKFLRGINISRAKNRKPLICSHPIYHPEIMDVLMENGTTKT